MQNIGKYMRVKGTAPLIPRKPLTCRKILVPRTRSLPPGRAAEPMKKHQKIIAKAADASDREVKGTGSDFGWP